MDQFVLPLAAAAGLGWAVGRTWRPARAVAHLGARATVGVARQSAALVGHGLEAGGEVAAGAARAAAPSARAGAAAVVGVYEGALGRFVGDRRGTGEQERPAPPPADEAPPPDEPAPPPDEPAPVAPPDAAPDAVVAAAPDTAVPDDDGGEPAEEPTGDLVAVSGGSKYHLPGCRVLGASSQLVDREVAEEEGRRPCGVCRP